MAIIELSPKNLRKALLGCAKKRRPAWVSGPPGVGKSQIIASMAREMGCELRDLRACLLESVDLRGLPRLTDKFAEWIPPSFLKFAGPAVLFLDELGQAPIPVQNACLSLALDRRIGENVLPDDVYVFAASNRLEDRAGVNRVTTALSSRFVQLNIVVSNDDWQEWAIQNAINPEVRSYLQFKPGMLCAFDAKEAVSPSPRSWDFASQLLEVADSDTEFALLAGTVGAGAAGEFLAYRRVYASLPSIEQVLFGKCDIPKKPDVTYALIGAATEYLRARLEDKKDYPETEAAVCKLFGRLDAEFAVAGYKVALAIAPALHKNAEARDWFTKHRGLFQS